MKIFDANTWIGRWPFSFAPGFDAPALAAHLRRHGLGRALVSPLDAVLQPEPGPANRALLHATRDLRSFVPVPVINPALANWREELAACAANPRVRAVRVLPNYHNWRLRGRAADALAAELARLRLRLIVQVRLVDERHEFHAMHLKGVPARELGSFLDAHPDLPVLASGLTRTELFALGPKHPRLLADLSFVEWHETLRDALTKVSARQLVFGSHTPFLITAASLAKLDRAGVKSPALAAIAAGNLERWLA